MDSIEERRLKAFQLGMEEFRSNTTTHFESDLIEYYDAGRDKAHELTNRKYDDPYPTVKMKIAVSIEKSFENEFRVISRTEHGLFDIITMPYTKSIYDAITQFGKLLYRKPVDVFHSLDSSAPLRIDYIKKTISEF
jgi:hypothetical protein